MQHTPQPFIPAPGALPALIEALPPDSTRATQMQFTRARQADFLSRLADAGEVRVAARASAVSHQSVYRMRRSCRAFRRAWDAALLVARDRAEDELATRALNGVEEEVWYHGEVVATRRRYDSRLLLAHLARLDRMEEREDVSELAECFDAVLDAFKDAGERMDNGSDGNEDRGEDAPGEPREAARDENQEEALDRAPVVLPTDRACDDRVYEAPVPEGEESSPGPCNMWSMSQSVSQSASQSASGDEEEDMPELERRLQAMEAAWPEGVEPVRGLSVEASDALEAVQLAAFEAGEERWWEAGLEAVAGLSGQWSRGEAPD